MIIVKLHTIHIHSELVRKIRDSDNCFQLIEVLLQLDNTRLDKSDKFGYSPMKILDSTNGYFSISLLTTIIAGSFSSSMQNTISY